MGTFVITLREGFEAALIVGLIFAYLAKTGQRQQATAVWWGVGAAVIISIAIGGTLYLSAGELDGASEQVYEGATMIFAAALVRPHLRLRHRPLHGQRDPQGDRRRPEHPGQGPDRGRDHQASRRGREPRGRGRSAQGALPERQAPAGDRLLPGPAPPPRASRARPAHQDQRARPQGPAPNERCGPQEGPAAQVSDGGIR